ncbi:hypothetical protein KSB_08610 [Ktedonobacter robiniae]|uniref:Uncharacterized protein n=1 Tax=Ktedonobacter robiniae TaxID=2778365 RepID=A0ABQ3UI48_9CHLR|nr:hypothetical protein KSB_08610 [Ktedonobacter robiniae]
MGSGLPSSLEMEESWRVILCLGLAAGASCSVCEGSPGICFGHSAIAGVPCGAPKGTKGVPGIYGVGCGG